MCENAIVIKDLTKIFKVYPDKSNSIKEKLLFFKRNKYEKHVVLDGISFDIKKGEAVGLIGKNGCGKSTTLKLINRIMYPTSGTVKVKGKVSSLIELGAGFHPDMSGRENIYINASIFGLTKKEIDSKLDEIIEFSELGELIDNPVRTYSSGMYMRLAFSVAINVRADVLLVDEILAVGDVSFQKKCFEKLHEIKKQGATIVIVSHSFEQIEQICDKSIWIENGHIREIGESRYIHQKYLREMEEERQRLIRSKKKDDPSFDVDRNTFCGRNVKRSGNGKISFTNVSIRDKDNKPENVFNTHDHMHIEYEFNVAKEVKDAIFSIKIYKNENICCYESDTEIENKQFVNKAENNKLAIEFNDLNLLNGEYMIDIEAKNKAGELFDSIHDSARIEIINTSGKKGICDMDTEWKII